MNYESTLFLKNYKGNFSMWLDLKLKYDKEEDLRVMERMIMSMITGARKVNELNTEAELIMNSYKSDDIIKSIKQPKAKLLGYVWRAWLS